MKAADRDEAISQLYKRRHIFMRRRRLVGRLTPDQGARLLTINEAIDKLELEELEELRR